MIESRGIGRGSAEFWETRTGEMSTKWIWPFELLEKIGEGGMGVVYRARYVGNDRIVAVKLLPETIAQNPTLVARFDRELEILSQLKHKHIVHCFGGTTESKQRFYAMEYLEGGTLSDLLRAKGRISWDHVIEYGIQICSGLQYAHDKGVIHRDLKPANFLLTKSGKLKLSDFGLATIIAGQRLTMAGKTAGTFLYMAPEQIRGKPPLSNRTDLYALGCVFFELLTGRPPFDADSPAEVLHKHLKEPAPRVAKSMLDCPKDLDTLVASLLQKDPELRPASAAEVERRLEAILRPSALHVDPFSRTPTASVAQLTTSADDSDDGYSIPASTSPRLVRGLYVTVVFAMLFSAWCWTAWWSSSSASARLTEVILQEAGKTGANQVAALGLVGRLPDLPPEGVELLFGISEGNAEMLVRVSALEALAQQAEATSHLHSRLLALEKDEPDPTVRSQMGITREALQRAIPGRSRFWWRSLVGILLTLGGVAAGLWVFQPSWLRFPR